MGAKDAYVGDEAKTSRAILATSYPIIKGVVEKWDDMEKVWHHTFYNELRVAPEDHPVLLSEPPLNPKACREKLVQIMFDTFNVPALYVASTAVLSLRAGGSTQGVVLLSGEGVTHVVPVVEGHVVPHAIRRLNVGGTDVTTLLQELLLKRGIEMKTPAERELLRDMKEKCSYVALDFDLECSKSSEVEKSYECPDGTIITVGKERFQCPEVLFQPDCLQRTGLLQRDKGEGVHTAIYRSIMQCSVDVRDAMYSNIVLSGGNTLFDGIEARLAKEMATLAPERKVTVRAPPSRKYSSWIGGSILGSLPAFEEIWITKEEYDKYGPGVVHSRCF